jgi:Skp family chaperone for outer membrane proteins
MNVPDWFVPILQQFPIVAIVLGAVWLVVKWVDRRVQAELDRERQRANEVTARADAEVARVRQDMARADRDHSAELRRSARMYENQLAALRERVRELEARLGGGDLT